MQLFYNPNISEGDSEINFDKEESRHIVKVLRMTEGDVLAITNGKGIIFTAEVANASPKTCTATIINSQTHAPLPYCLHMAVAPTKLNDRYEWFLEKATEIGVSAITPVICDHSERKVIKPERYEKILQSAMKQSLKAYLPILNEAIPLGDFIQSQKDSEAQRLIAHCEEDSNETVGNVKKSIKTLVKPRQDVTILIGPEGDFSPAEIALALDNGFVPISLGNSRLRTETAAVVACHSVAFVNEE